MTWSEIWCDVDNSKRFRSSCSRHVSQGHRLKGVAALHNFLASIFTAPGVTTWRDMSGNTRKNQVTRLVTLRHQSTMSEALVSGNFVEARAPLVLWKKAFEPVDNRLGSDQLRCLLMAATGHNEGTWSTVGAFPGRREKRIHDLPGAVVVVGHEVRVGGKDNLLRVAKVGSDLGEAEPG